MPRRARYIQGHKSTRGRAHERATPVHSTSKEADVETTAELPVLDVAAYEAALSEERSGSTDTWHLPALQSSAAGHAAAAVSAHAAATPGTPASTPVDRTMQLEIDLRSLSESLRDVEERLTRKGERLIELERELANARAERSPSSSAPLIALKCALEASRALSAASDAKSRASQLMQRSERCARRARQRAERATNLQATVESAIRPLPRGAP